MSAIEKEVRYGLKPKNGSDSEILPLKNECFTIGNSPDSTLVIKNDKILKRHAVLEMFLRSSDWYVKSFCDLQVPGRVCVNGNRIKKNQRQSLKTGDLIAFADFEYVFCNIDGATSSEKRKRNSDPLLDDFTKRLKSFEDEVKSLQLQQKNKETKCDDCNCSKDHEASTSMNSSRFELETLRIKLDEAETEITSLRKKVEQLEDEKTASIMNQIEVGRARDAEVSLLKMKLANSEIATVQLRQDNEKLELEIVDLRKERNNDCNISQLEEKLQQAENILAKLKK